MKRLALVTALAGLAVSACATTPTCREADMAERAAFAQIVAGHPGGLADSLPTESAALAGQLRDGDTALRNQIFGQRMGDYSVRTVLMQPPLCVYEQPVSSTERISYVFPNGRFQTLNPEGTTAANLGSPARDHARCHFRLIDGQWRLTDACTSTFQTPAPVS
ncbi:MAG: hypothetical protein ACQRW7_00380 [Caulobacterales bacterium]|uniref:hypothetical protein n=1 Tax=Glycocaulis sp. TaxID=1969725 RepID=UPI003F9EC54D